ncbi:MAG TPA: cupredoxin domain-containing protein [Actinomycetota bacterium]|nr:cupredoxin domain-containing protein [Actinomycetota bacterium]
MALILLLAACGGGGSGDDGNAATPPILEEGSPAEDEAGAQEDCLTAEPSGTEIELITRGMAFKPATLKAAAGEVVTVSYTNEDSVPHTFTAEAIGCDSNTVAADDSVQLTFEMPEGTTEFVCTIHPSMKGRLVAT